MQTFRPILVTCATAILFVPVCVTADQLAKSGSYSGKYSFSERVVAVPVEKDHLFTAAVNQGLFFNTAGNGFLHGAMVACTSVGAIEQEQYSFSGNCAATDKDGDKALLKWACARQGERCFGTFDWIGGTGKYKGMTGHSVFDGVVLGQGPIEAIGDANWKGEWRLP